MSNNFTKTTTTGLAREITVKRDFGSYYLRLRDTSEPGSERSFGPGRVQARLTDAQAREIAHALLEAIGDDVPAPPVFVPPVGATVYVDKEAKYADGSTASERIRGTLAKVVDPVDGGGDVYVRTLDDRYSGYCAPSYLTVVKVEEASA